jgi:hypothetical protein
LAADEAKERLEVAIGGIGRIILLAALAGVASAAATPAVGEAGGWRQAVDLLAQEKSLAEGCASLLKTFGDDAPMARVQGQRRYARAKADMDGLIGLLIADLTRERPLAAAPELRQRLEAVVAQRRTLCRQTDAAVGSALRQHSARAGAADLLAEAGGDAPRSLIEASVQIRHSYRAADQAGRAAIISGIEAARWLAYAELPAAW